MIIILVMIMILFPSNIYLFKHSKRNTRKTCDVRRFGVFIVNFEHISHLFLVFLLFSLNK